MEDFPGAVFVMAGVVMWVACAVNLVMFTRRKYITKEVDAEDERGEEQKTEI